MFYVLKFSAIQTLDSASSGFKACYILGKFTESFISCTATDRLVLTYKDAFVWLPLITIAMTQILQFFKGTTLIHYWILTPEYNDADEEGFAKLYVGSHPIICP